MRTGWRCKVLSTKLHRDCDWGQCECPCHVTDASVVRRLRRPHSYPREDWKHHRKPGTTDRMKREGLSTP